MVIRYTKMWENVDKSHDIVKINLLFTSMFIKFNQTSAIYMYIALGKYILLYFCNKMKTIGIHCRSP